MTVPRICVMQMLDTLETGGAEQVAVTIANHLPRDRYVSYLCTTRRDGPLEHSIAGDVARLRLRRKHSLDPAAVAKLVRFVREKEIQIVHAHGSTVFLAGLAGAFGSAPALVWHQIGRASCRERV